MSQISGQPTRRYPQDRFGQQRPNVMPQQPVGLGGNYRSAGGPNTSPNVGVGGYGRGMDIRSLGPMPGEPGYQGSPLQPGGYGGGQAMRPGMSTPGAAVPNMNFPTSFPSGPQQTQQQQQMQNFQQQTQAFNAMSPEERNNYMNQRAMAEYNAKIASGDTSRGAGGYR